jgi:hypothetical protein
MADTSHVRAALPATEGDGINYRGIVWFVVILVLTTLVCQLLMWGLFDFFARQAAREDTARPPLAAPAGQPAPPPNLLTDEPGNLRQFREKEDAILTTYDWIDKNAGTVRIPIDRAKALLLERGIPGGTAMPVAPPAKGK